MLSYKNCASMTHRLLVVAITNVILVGALEKHFSHGVVNPSLFFGSIESVLYASEMKERIGGLKLKKTAMNRYCYTSAYPHI